MRDASNETSKWRWSFGNKGIKVDGILGRDKNNSLEHLQCL